MRIILAGKHELSVRLFEGLYGKYDNSVGFITCKTERSSQRESLKTKLLEHNIKPLNHDYSHDALLEAVKKFKPDLFISAGFDKIIKPKVIGSIENCVNVHFGMLPKYRGSYSIPWAILNNEEFIGTTLHKIDSGIDSGNIILQTKIKNDWGKSCKELYLEAVNTGLMLVLKYIDMLSTGVSITTISQDERLATYYPTEFLNSFRIPWKQSTNFVYNYIRASYFPPLEPAHTMLGGIKIGVEFPIEYVFEKHDHSSSKIVEFAGHYWVTALNGMIRPISIIRDGKRHMFDNYITTNNLYSKNLD